MDYSSIIKSFSKSNILVIGDVMLDHYLWGKTNRISPEAPVPIVNLERESYALGGAGNVAANITALGGSCTIAGYVGSDQQAGILRSILKEKSIDTILLSTLHPTITKMRIISESHHMLRVDHEERYDEEIPSFYDILKTRLSRFDLVVISDYNKGTITQNLVDFLKQENKKIIVDPKPENISFYKDVYLIKPNYSEAKKITQKQTIEEMGIELQKKTNSNIIITLGRKGMSIFSMGLQSINISANVKNVYDVTGAGDTTLAAIALAIANNADLYTAARIANNAAGIKVGKVGTEAVTQNELLLSFQESINLKIKSLEELIEYTTIQKQAGKKIVFTNGCYDLLHIGHTRLLQKAKELGDLLVLAVNSDESVKRLKGNSRPIYKQQERAELLSNLSSVDAIVFFEEDTPEQIIKKIKPDVLVKGSDYTFSTTVGAEFVRSYGGNVVIIPLVEGCSTSEIIDKIKKS
ncbi:D-glycero-beta-D-manno-heptose 1-phosphate adenylyltransferase [Candidatus Woesearchaeota archaeon]|nr:D-glycero-beta-D-manno-heptose 1-phosphate adenylyltransferase [Candidatus Woesearchaeota archaeon]